MNIEELISTDYYKYISFFILICEIFIICLYCFHKCKNLDEEEDDLDVLKRFSNFKNNNEYLQITKKTNNNNTV